MSGDFTLLYFVRVSYFARRDSMHVGPEYTTREQGVISLLMKWSANGSDLVLKLFINPDALIWLCSFIVLNCAQSLGT